MRNQLVSKCLIVVCSLATSLSAAPTFANWYVNQSEGYYKPQQYYNHKYGDFPPADIEQQIFKQLEESKKVLKESPSQGNNTSTPSGSQTLDTKLVQPYSQSNVQQPAYGSYNRNRNYAPQRYQNYNRNSNFSGPWNNSGSNFSGPWNNNGSNFSGPWNNNGSNFSMPWGNNGSGFNPMGNGSGWSW